MTIETSYAPLISQGNSSTTSFPLSWPFAAPSDIVVNLIAVATGLPASPPPALNGPLANDYTVTGTPDPDTGIYPSGAVVFNVAPPGLYNVSRARATEDEQDKLLPSNGSFPAKAVEGALDRRTLLSQEQGYEASVVASACAAAIIAGTVATAAAAAATGAAGTVGSGASLWQRPAKSINTAPPGSPATGDRYLVDPAGGTGSWAGHGGEVTEWNGAVWLFSGAPQANQILDVGNTTYRYSQEAYDSGVAWRPAFFTAGGARGLYDPPDEPCGLGNVSTAARTTCAMLYGLGTTAVLHTGVCTMTAGVPGSPPAGSNVFSGGFRIFSTLTSTYEGSTVALEAVSTQDGTGEVYPASYFDIETSATSVRNIAATFTQNRCLIVNGSYPTDELAQLTVIADNGLPTFKFFTGAAIATANLVIAGALSTQTMANGQATGATAISVQKDATTGSSAHLAGTLGTSGADVAEYETKASDCGVIPKGAPAAYDGEGYLTDRFSRGVSFGVKSTDPNLVGGDTHITTDTHGHRPSNPGESRAPKLRQEHHLIAGSEDHDRENCPDCTEHRDGVAAWRVRHAEWEAYIAKLPELQAAWDAETEKARAQVDRIAKCGKVPVIVQGDVFAGGYLAAVAGPDDSIIAVCQKDHPGANVIGRVRTANPDEQRLRRLINKDIPLDARWNAIAEVMHG